MVEVARGGSVLSYDRYWQIVLLLSHPRITLQFYNMSKNISLQII